MGNKKCKNFIFSIEHFSSYAILYIVVRHLQSFIKLKIYAKEETVRFADYAAILRDR